MSVRERNGGLIWFVASSSVFVFVSLFRSYCSASPKVVIVLSGKRKSGKDYVAEKLKIQLDGVLKTKITTIGRLSGPLKRTYATKHNLDYKRLLSDGPYKEMFRKDMIVWGESSRKKNFRVFADIVLSDSRNSDVLIVSDARRVTDMTCFRNQKAFQTISIRVQASVKERSKRGFVFKTGIDDAESECGLDNVHHDVMVYNQGPAAMSRNSKAVRKLQEFRTTPNYIGGVDDQLYTIALHVKKLL